MGIIGDIGDLLGGIGGLFGGRPVPTSSTSEGYMRPTFDPEVLLSILETLPGMTDLFGNQMAYDAESGQWGMTPGAGPTYSEKMKQYIESTGKDVYEQQVLPRLQRRGVLSRPFGQESREESLATRDWGKMIADEALKASAEGEQLDVTQKLGSQASFLKALDSALQGAGLAAGKNFWMNQTYYY